MIYPQSIYSFPSWHRALFIAFKWNFPRPFITDLCPRFGPRNIFQLKDKERQIQICWLRVSFSCGFYWTSFAEVCWNQRPETRPSRRQPCVCVCVEKNHNNLFDLPAQWCQLWDGVQNQHKFSQLSAFSVQLACPGSPMTETKGDNEMRGCHCFSLSLSQATHLIWQTWAVLSREMDGWMAGKTGKQRGKSGEYRGTPSDICGYGRVNDDTLHVCQVTRPCTKYWWGWRHTPLRLAPLKLGGTCKVCNTFCHSTETTKCCWRWW